MKMQAILLGLLGFFLGILAPSVGAALWQQAAVPDAVIVSPELYKLEFENDFVRVVRAHYGPRANGVMHSHPDPGAVVVTLTDRNLKQTLPDGTSREVHSKAGQANWAIGETHRAENLDDRPLEFIRVDVKKQACR